NWRIGKIDGVAHDRHGPPFLIRNFYAHFPVNDLRVFEHLLVVVNTPIRDIVIAQDIQPITGGLACERCSNFRNQSFPMCNPPLDCFEKKLAPEIWTLYRLAEPLPLAIISYRNNDVVIGG